MVARRAAWREVPTWGARRTVGAVVLRLKSIYAPCALDGCAQKPPAYTHMYNLRYGATGAGSARATAWYVTSVVINLDLTIITGMLLAC